MFIWSIVPKSWRRDFLILFWIITKYWQVRYVLIALLNRMQHWYTCSTSAVTKLVPVLLQFLSLIYLLLGVRLPRNCLHKAWYYSFITYFQYFICRTVPLLLDVPYFLWSSPATTVSSFSTAQSNYHNNLNPSCSTDCSAHTSPMRLWR